MTMLKAAPLCICLLFALVFSSGSTQAKTFKILHVFTGDNDGVAPFGGLVMDNSGNLFGTTAGGGKQRCRCGTLYMLAPDGTHTVLHSFSGLAEAFHERNDGAWPRGSLARDARGNLFGSTYEGGAGVCDGYGCGTVFKLDRNGRVKMIHIFVGTWADGAMPVEGPILDGAGNVYGAGTVGGQSGSGAVYKITPDKQEALVHSFGGGADGVYPEGRLLRDAAGFLYGTTYTGGVACPDDGIGCGTVFKLGPDGTNTVLLAFTGGHNGSLPERSLTMDAQGNLYGTTSYSASGFGVAFKLAPDGTETVLHEFSGGKDGGTPSSGLLLLQDGNLYGTTIAGGTTNCDCGVLFKITPDGTLSVLHTFLGSDGYAPAGDLIADKQGTIYGVTTQGGSCGYDASGCGVVYSVRVSNRH